MASFTIKEIRLHRIEVPLKKPFTTHLQSVEVRESILIEVVDEHGNIGLGECVAFHLLGIQKKRFRLVGMRLSIG